MRPRSLAPLIPLLLVTASCGTLIDADKARMCRLALPAVHPDATAITVARVEPAAKPYDVILLNGATEVASWQVLLGPSATGLQPVAVADRTGFETAITLGAVTGYAAVTALDAAGQSLASSRPIPL